MISAVRSIRGKGRETMKRILIVDVDTNTGLFLKYELEGGGYAIDLAHEESMTADSDERLEYAALIFNMRMPCLDYFKRLERIKRNNPRSSIIVFANRTTPEKRASLLNAGADACFDRQAIGMLITYLRRIEGSLPAIGALITA